MKAYICEQCKEAKPGRAPFRVNHDEGNEEWEFCGYLCIETWAGGRARSAIEHKKFMDKIDADERARCGLKDKI